MLKGERKYVSRTRIGCAVGTNWSSRHGDQVREARVECDATKKSFAKEVSFVYNTSLLGGYQGIVIEGQNLRGRDRS